MWEKYLKESRDQKDVNIGGEWEAGEGQTHEDIIQKQRLFPAQQITLETSEDRADDATDHNNRGCWREKIVLYWRVSNLKRRVLLLTEPRAFFWRNFEVTLLVLELRQKKGRRGEGHPHRHVGLGGGQCGGDLEKPKRNSVSNRKFAKKGDEKRPSVYVNVYDWDKDNSYSRRNPRPSETPRPENCWTYLWLLAEPSTLRLANGDDGNLCNPEVISRDGISQARPSERCLEDGSDGRRTPSRLHIIVASRESRLKSPNTPRLSGFNREWISSIGSSRNISVYDVISAYAVNREEKSLRNMLATIFGFVFSIINK